MRFSEMLFFRTTVWPRRWPVAHATRQGLRDCIFARYTLRYLWEHWAQLSEFEPLQQVPLAQARDLLEAIVVLDAATQNTDQEVREGLRYQAVLEVVLSFG